MTEAELKNLKAKLEADRRMIEAARARRVEQRRELEEARRIIRRARQALSELSR